MTNLSMSRNKKTLVITGSSGFVGESLALAAIELGYFVIGIDLKKSNNLDCQQYVVDLAQESINHLVPNGATIIHLASLSTDTLCRENPINAIDSNLRATSMVVDAAKKSDASHLIFASSEWVYPEKTDSRSQIETDFLSIQSLNSLYAISKLVGESIIRTTSSTPYSLLRFGIVYGPRSIPGSAAESLALKVYKKESVSVGSAMTSRCFIYLDDLVEAILMVTEFGSISGDGISLNLAGKKLISLAHVVTTANLITGNSIAIIDGGSIPSIRNPSIDRARRIIKWQPTTEFSTGISKCLDKMTIKET